MAQIEDGYERFFDPRETAALELTDALIGDPRSLSDAAREALREQFSDAELVEVSLGVSLFLAMSKVLIVLGLEPEDMADSRRGQLHPRCPV